MVQDVLALPKEAPSRQHLTSWRKEGPLGAKEVRTGEDSKWKPQKSYFYYLSQPFSDEESPINAENVEIKNLRR